MVAVMTERLLSVEAIVFRPNVSPGCDFVSFLIIIVPDIISTVGPRGEHPDILRAAYSNCLNKMKENKLKSIVGLKLLENT